MVDFQHGEHLILVSCCPQIWGTRIWEILKEVHENQLCILTYS